MCPRCMHQPYEKCNGVMRVFCYQHGGVAEWLNAAVLKTVRLERVSGVRIPPPPPVAEGPSIRQARSGFRLLVKQKLEKPFANCGHGSFILRRPVEPRAHMPGHQRID